MAIMRTNDWKKLVQLCKDEIQKTEGDKRAARGLLYRLIFYITENRLTHPQRRKQESPIQTLMFDRASRGEPLSPKEVVNVPHDDIQLSGPAELPTEKEDQERPQHDGQADTDTTGSPEPSSLSRGEEAGEVSQHSDPGGRDQVQIGEGGEKIPGIIDGGKVWPDLEP